jgi:hypothetical protein
MSLEIFPSLPAGTSIQRKLFFFKSRVNNVYIITIRTIVQYSVVCIPGNDAYAHLPK